MDWSRLITRGVGWTVGVFHRLERTGGQVPPGPVLVVANHPNALLDPLVIFRVAGRPTRPLAKAPLFQQRFVGTLLRGLGGLPVYRAEDDASQMYRNEDTFRGAIDALLAGDAVQIYPEGRSHSEPALVPMRTGAARIALGAEAAAGWSLGLRIVPIGLTYVDKTRFRGRLLAVVGEPFDIAHLQQLHAGDDFAAARALTDEIAARLHEVTVNVERQRDADLIDTAERLYAREKGAVRWRERDALADRLPRLQAFADGTAWLRATDPDRYARLSRAVAGYRRRARVLGATEADVPPRYPLLGTASYVLQESIVLLALAPLALPGMLVWYPTWLAPNLTLRIVRPYHEAIATYKLATGFVAVPLTILVVALIAGWIGGWTWATAALIVTPLAGLAAISFLDRLRRFADDTAVFFRAAGRSRLRERLAAERAALTHEFDALLELRRQKAPATK